MASLYVITWFCSTSMPHMMDKTDYKVICTNVFIKLVTNNNTQLLINWVIYQKQLSFYFFVVNKLILWKIIHNCW